MKTKNQACTGCVEAQQFFAAANRRRASWRSFWRSACEIAWRLVIGLLATAAVLAVAGFIISIGDYLSDLNAERAAAKKDLAVIQDRLHDTDNSLFLFDNSLILHGRTISNLDEKVFRLNVNTDLSDSVMRLQQKYIDRLMARVQALENRTPEVSNANYLSNHISLSLLQATNFIYFTNWPVKRITNMSIIYNGKF